MGAGGFEDGSSNLSAALASGAQMTKRSGEARRFREWGALAFAGGLILGCTSVLEQKFEVSDRRV